MTDPIIVAMLALSTLAGISILCFAMLRGWRAWLEVQRLALSGDQRAGGMEDDRSSVTRIELADLRERVRKLEAIAAGVDL
ncbi:hypothetical protein [Sphingomonas quercus]|uniref:Phage shock protein B n=1 Tax=Sphingomonas quercus TaxID=2842451 RepID=A0ABS6BMB4_9SPHN|nr:hypothetical protein [Sphingomonas quercus]MBU3078384.1 hypothetical protein [Sphingomonas quercus]